MRRRRRTLSPEELDLWARVRAQTVPLHGPSAERLHATVIEPVPPLPPDAIVVAPARPTETRRQSAAAALGPAHRSPIEIDRHALQRLRRGKLAPEARIDLHGMTQAEAHAALTGFVLLSQATGRRLVLVITGKGRGGGAIGVLRAQVPRWLALAPLGPVVLHITEAHRSHGGSGALYVYLRRSR